MGSLQSKPIIRASAAQQPPSISNNHSRVHTNHSGLYLPIDTTQHEGSLRQTRSIEHQGPGTFIEMRDPISPIDTYGTSTAVAELDQTGPPRAWDNRYLLRLPEGKEQIALKDLYQPGDTVFKKDLDAWRAYKVKRSEFYPPDSILVHSYFLDFDKTGEFLVPQLTVLTVPAILSKRYIEELDVIPRPHFERHYSLRNKLIERGRLYASYAGGVSYREYTGDSWPRTPQKVPIKVIVDYATASRHEQDTISVQQCTESGVCSVCSGERAELLFHPGRVRHDPDICQRSPESGLQTERHSSDESLLFCPPKLWAFSLSHNCWRMVLPNHLAAVQKRDDAFNKLLLTENHKKHLGSMLSRLGVERSKKSRGIKGRGFNILLTGNPGTGKTFTVETIAEKNGVPLYKIAPSDLGSNPEILESKLDEAMLRAANWGATLLLDGVDIFLSRSNNAPQSVLLSILLRQLERSNCVFFMTTHTQNKLQDDAILSRLYLAVNLPNLTLEDQKAIWSGCIRDIDDLSPDYKKELDQFIDNGLELFESGAFTNLNGRQIKNCVAAALAVALNDGTTLTPDHIKAMLKLGKEFKDAVVKTTVASSSRLLGLHR